MERPRCGAKTRSGQPCRSPVVFPNGRCRLHGGPCSKHRIEQDPIPAINAPYMWRHRPVSHKAVLGNVYPPRLFNIGLANKLAPDGSEGYDDQTGMPVVALPGVARRAAWICDCGRRVITLFRPLIIRPGGYVFEGHWRCRTCCGYQSAGANVSSIGKGAIVRAFGQAQRIERIIGEGRPKGMWRSTYERLLTEWKEHQARARDIF